MEIYTEILSGHNLKGGQWNELNFVVRKFLYKVNICAKFHKNWKESGYFFGDLVWNDPYTCNYRIITAYSIIRVNKKSYSVSIEKN